MTTWLVAGFYVFTLLVMVSMIITVSIMTQRQMYKAMDDDLSLQAYTLQAILQNEEAYLAGEATTIANLEGISEALDRDDTAQLKRLLLPVLKTHNLDSMYLIDGQRRVLLHLGLPMTDDAKLVYLPLADRGFNRGKASGLLELNGSLWWGVVSVHSSPDEKHNVIVLLGKSLDRRYLQSIHKILGPQIALVLGSTVVYSFEESPPTLSPTQLRPSETKIVGDDDNPITYYYGVTINDEPYRVVSFNFSSDLSSRDGRNPSVFLFQQTTAIADAVRLATAHTIGIGLVIMIVGSFLVYLYASTITRPLHRLAHAAMAITDGDLEKSIQIEGQDEVAQVAQAFEDMRLQVQVMIRAQRQWSEELEEKVRAKTAELRKLSSARDQLLRETIAVQEEERRRVARELHDETSQSLAALIANLATVQRLPPEETLVHLDEIKAMAVEALKGVNRIVLNLRPTLLDDYGLIPALSWNAEQRLAGCGIRVEISTVGSEMHMPSEVETALFRIGQEAITNIFKYAKASHVQINFLFEDRETGPRITLQIEDDGCGFDLEKVKSNPPGRRPPLGLVGMEERMNLVGGQLKIRSAPGEGTSICATVSLESYMAEEGRNK